MYQNGEFHNRVLKRGHVSLIVEMLYFIKIIFSTARHRLEKSKGLMTTEGPGHTKIVNVMTSFLDAKVTIMYNFNDA